MVKDLVSEPLLSVRGLSIEVDQAQPRALLLDEITMATAVGEAVGITGQSGSGKSTLLNSILGLVDQRHLSNGTITFNGARLVSDAVQDDNAIRKVRGNSLALIEQNPFESLHPMYRVRSQLSEHLRGHLKLKRRASRNRVVGALEAAGVPAPEELLSKYPYQLSGGEAQRVCLAMALLTEPKLLLADEVLSALDDAAKADVLATLCRLTDNGMAMLFVSHDLDAIATACSRVIVLFEGRIVEDGPVSDVLSRPSHQHTKALVSAHQTLTGT